MVTSRRGHIVVCELWLKGLRGLKLSRMELVRNDDLTFSALKILVELPSVILTGKFRLSVLFNDRDEFKRFTSSNNVYVFSIIHAKDSEGTIDANLSGVKVKY